MSHVSIIRNISSKHELSRALKVPTIEVVDAVTGNVITPAFRGGAYFEELASGSNGDARYMMYSTNAEAVASNVPVKPDTTLFVYNNPFPVGGNATVQQLWSKLHGTMVARHEQVQKIINQENDYRRFLIEDIKSNSFLSTHLGPQQDIETMSFLQIINDVFRRILALDANDERIMKETLSKKFMFDDKSDSNPVQQFNIAVKNFNGIINFANENGIVFRDSEKVMFAKQAFGTNHHLKRSWDHQALTNPNSTYAQFLAALVNGATLLGQNDEWQTVLTRNNFSSRANAVTVSVTDDIIAPIADSTYAFDSTANGTDGLTANAVQTARRQSSARSRTGTAIFLPTTVPNPAVAGTAAPPTVPLSLSQSTRYIKYAIDNPLGHCKFHPGGNCIAGTCRRMIQIKADFKKLGDA